MRMLILFAVAASLAGQEPTAAPDKPAASPVPNAEAAITGTIDVGYRWRTDVSGSFETWRSVVNLGSGPKLSGAEFTILSPRRKLFDTIHVRGYDWGGDPYSTFHLDATKQDLYRFNADYRVFQYFNNLPSFADPLLTRGIFLNEQSFDLRRRISSFNLDLMPGRRIAPFLGFDRAADSGHGVTVFQTDGNEYAIPAQMANSSDLYRGGVHITGNRYHVTLEQGGTTFRSDESTFSQLANAGNVRTPVLGQTLGLTTLLRATGVRGSSVYSRAIVTASPFPWLDVSASFLFAQPKNEVNYSQADTGSFVLLRELLFYSGQQSVLAATAKMPHTAANLGFEVRPLARVRVLESWSTDRLHNAGSSTGRDTLLAPGVSTTFTSALTAALATNRSQVETNVIFDLTRSITLRGGHRYVWGLAYDTVLPPEGLITVTRTILHQHVGLGGVTLRRGSRLWVTGEIEAASTGGGYYRTSLYDYRRVRLQGRYQLLKTVQLHGNYRLLSNENPLGGTGYYLLGHQESMAVAWIPAARKWNFDGAYEHCGYQSRIGYLIPQTLRTSVSVYREDCHTVSGTLHAEFAQVRLSAGGSLVKTSGTRPTAWYQPAIRINGPLVKRVGWYGEWRYYGFGETFSLYESFRAHLIGVGLRFRI